MSENDFNAQKVCLSLEFFQVIESRVYIPSIYDCVFTVDFIFSPTL